MPQFLARITIACMEIPYCFLMFANSKVESLFRCSPSSALMVSSGNSMAPANWKHKVSFSRSVTLPNFNNKCANSCKRVKRILSGLFILFALYATTGIFSFTSVCNPSNVSSTYNLTTFMFLSSNNSTTLNIASMPNFQISLNFLAASVICS
jgi:hypothetical protein